MQPSGIGGVINALELIQTSIMIHRSLFPLFIGLAMTMSAIAQETQTTVDFFNKVELGQRISAIIEPGDAPGIRYELHGIHPDELVISNSGNTLEVYLKHARNLEKQKKVYDDGYKHKIGWYEGGYVNVYISYTELKKLIVKGEHDVDILGTITTDIFKVKAYGDMDVEFEDLIAEKLKVKMYGECSLKLKDGAIAVQKYKLFGENHIDARNVAGQMAKATNYGETSLSVNTETVKFTVFGEIDVNCGRGTNVRKGMVLGEYSVSQW